MGNKGFQITLVAAAISALVPDAALAQTREKLAIEEIVVTAQRREQSLSEVGIAVTAFTEDQLRDLGLGQPIDLAAQTPNLQINNILGNSVPNITLRGIGVSDYAANNNPAAGVYVDDVSLTSPVMASFQMFDIERVEVLKGPQGTLYGRNTTAGAVNFISNKPSESLEARAKVDYGRYDYKAAEFSVAGPLADGLGGRLAVSRVDQGEGHQTNGRNGEDVGAVDRTSWRAMLQWQPSDDFEALINVHGGRDKSDALLVKLYSDDDGEPQHAYASNDPAQDVDSSGAVLTLNWALSDSLSLTSITGYETLDRRYVEDRDGSALIMLDADYRSEVELWSQELRLIQDVTPDLSIIWGLFYSEDKVDAHDDFSSVDLLALLGLSPATNIGNYYDQKTTSAAAFAHAQWQFAPDWNLTAGLRYTEESKDFNDVYTYLTFGGADVGLFDPVNESLDSDDLSGKLGIDYSGIEDLLLYASVSKGYKSGGFQGQLAFQPELLRAFDEETLWAYEAGFKARFLDSSLQFNGTVFFYDYQDMQAYGNYESPIGPLFGLTNIGDVEIFGAEADLWWRPAEGLDISLGVGLLDTDVVSPRVADVAAGNQLPNSPELSLNGLIRYEFDLTDGLRMFSSLDFSFQDDKYFDIYETPEALEDAYWMVNARLGVATRDDRWRVSLWGRNLADETYRTTTLLSSVGFTDTFGIPATYGISLEYNWQ